MTGEEATARSEARAPAWWLKDYQEECPNWHVWRGVNFKYYGSRALTTPPVVQRGDTPAELLKHIRAAESDHRSWWEADE
jgi:hypothetical protein